LDSFPVHHQESSTVHTAIGICHTGYADCLLASIHHQESSTVHTTIHTGYADCLLASIHHQESSTVCTAIHTGYADCLLASIHHQESSTVHTAIHTGYADCLLASIHYQESSNVHTAIHTGYVDCLLASIQHNLYHIYLLLCVQCWTPDGGQRSCLKHVEFYSKNKFEELVHLVGFILRVFPKFMCISHPFEACHMLHSTLYWWG
jgi:hypothetical protein